jgi:hypothetical protein
MVEPPVTRRRCPLTQSRICSGKKTSPSFTTWSSNSVREWRTSIFGYSLWMGGSQPSSSFFPPTKKPLPRLQKKRPPPQVTTRNSGSRVQQRSLRSRLGRRSRKRSWPSVSRRKFRRATPRSLRSRFGRRSRRRSWPSVSRRTFRRETPRQLLTRTRAPGTTTCNGQPEGHLLKRSRGQAICQSMCQTIRQLSNPSRGLFFFNSSSSSSIFVSSALCFLRLIRTQVLELPGWLNWFLLLEQFSNYNPDDTQFCTYGLVL